MIWNGKGLLIKLHQMGIEGNFFNWMDFLSGRTIKVKMGSYQKTMWQKIVHTRGVL